MRRRLIELLRPASRQRGLPPPHLPACRTRCSRRICQISGCFRWDMPAFLDVCKTCTRNALPQFLRRLITTPKGNRNRRLPERTALERLLLLSLLLTSSQPLRMNFCVLCPLGWTQVDTVFLFRLKIKMEERTAVDIAGAVFCKRLVMRASTLALVHFETVFRISFCEARHKAVAHHFRGSGSERDNGHRFVSADDGLLAVFGRRRKKAVEIDKNAVRLGRESADGARGRRSDRAREPPRIDPLCTSAPHTESDVAVSHAPLQEPEKFRARKRRHL